MDDYDYNLISFKNKLRLLQHKSNTLINKAIIIINSRDMKSILTGMICPD